MRIISVFLVLFLNLFSPVLAEETVELLPYQRLLTLTSFTRAKAELSVAGEVSGRCTRILVDRGDIVPPSGVVAELDSTFVRLDLEKNSIAQKQARLQLDLEKKTLSRYTTLMQSNSAAQATFDEASLRADLHELTLESLKNEQARLKETLDRHTLYGPPGWQVVDRFIEEGAFVHQGEPVLRLGDFRQLLMHFMLSYEELELLQKMTSISLQFPELSITAPGQIYRVSPDFDAKSRKIPVELILSPPATFSAASLRGGLRANLTIAGREERGSFVIPSSALISRYEAHWLVKADGQRKKVIVLGTNEDGQQAIVTGNELIPGETFLAFPESSSRKEHVQPGS
jgi:RND family efflux transporter MFP subunit